MCLVNSFKPFRMDKSPFLIFLTSPPTLIASLAPSIILSIFLVSKPARDKAAFAPGAKLSTALKKSFCLIAFLAAFALFKYPDTLESMSLPPRNFSPNLFKSRFNVLANL